MEVAEVFRNDEVYSLQKKQLSLENVNIVRKYEKHSNTMFDWGQMEQVFGNLFINAKHAMHKTRNKRITILVKEK